MNPNLVPSACSPTPSSHNFRSAAPYSSPLPNPQIPISPQQLGSRNASGNPIVTPSSGAYSAYSSYQASGYYPANSSMAGNSVGTSQFYGSSIPGGDLIAASSDPATNIHMGSKLFVGQVPAVCTEEMLRPLFEPYGTILEVKIMRDHMGRSKGSAWVRYATEEMASKAIAFLHEKHTIPPQTNPLRVQFATPSSAKVHYAQAPQGGGYPPQAFAPTPVYQQSGTMSAYGAGYSNRIAANARYNEMTSVPYTTSVSRTDQVGRREYEAPFAVQPAKLPFMHSSGFPGQPAQPDPTNLMYAANVGPRGMETYTTAGASGPRGQLYTTETLTVMDTVMPSGDSSTAWRKQPGVSYSQ